MARMHKYHSRTKRVRFSEVRKVNELRAMQEIVGQYPLLSCGFRSSTVSPNHECMAVEFSGTLEEHSLRFVVEIIPSVRFPYEEPAAVVLEPDIRPLFRDPKWRQSLPRGLHTYADSEFEGRLICSHLSEWDPKCSLMKFFVGTINPWANNFLAFVLTDGLWSPDRWFTKGD